jgi:hypothetical protein
MIYGFYHNQISIQDTQDPLRGDWGESQENISKVAGRWSLVAGEIFPHAKARSRGDLVLAVYESHRMNAPVPLPLEHRRNPLLSYS